MFHVEHSEAVDRKSRRRERSKSGGIGPKRHIWANVPCGTQESRWTALDNFGGISDIQFCSTWNILNFVGWTLIELGYAGGCSTWNIGTKTNRGAEGSECSTWNIRDALERKTLKLPHGSLQAPYASSPQSPRVLFDGGTF
jgi:hypothetical protein